MSFVAQHGLIVSALLAVPMVLLVASVFFAALRRFEVAIVVLVVSPWMHWVFGSNEEIDLLAEAVQETGAGTYLRMGMVFLAGCVGYVRAVRSQAETPEPIPRQFVFLVAFLGLALLSTGYSISRAFTLVRTGEAIAFLGFLLGFHAWLRDSAALDRGLRLLTMLLAGGIVLNVGSLGLLPGRAWWVEAPNRFQGLTSQPNEMGMFCMVSYPLLMWRVRNGTTAGRGAAATLLLAALAMHVMSGSRSSFLCAGVGMMLWHLLLRQRMKLALLGVTALMAGALVSSSALPSLERNESDELTDLTGRPEFWKHGIELVLHRPLLGYGHQVSGEVWSDPRFASAQLENSWGSARTSLHNGYLDTLIGLGVVGLVLWLAVLLMPLRDLVRPPLDDLKVLALVMLSQLLLLNFVETVITSSRSFGSIVFWYFWVIGGSLPALVGGRASALEFEQPPETPLPAKPFTTGRRPLRGVLP